MGTKPQTNSLFFTSLHIFCAWLARESTQMISCSKCEEDKDDDKIFFCDRCNLGYHYYCVGLKGVPEGKWYCKLCVKEVPELAPKEEPIKKEKTAPTTRSKSKSKRKSSPKKRNSSHKSK